MGSCGPCFCDPGAVKFVFVILNEKKQQFLKLNWHLAGGQQKQTLEGGDKNEKRVDKSLIEWKAELE